jgi:hypothetical protein
MLSTCYAFSHNVRNIIKKWLNRTFSNYNVSNITLDIQEQVNLSALGHVYHAHTHP